MRTFKYKRTPKPGTVKLCDIWIMEDPQISLDFGKKDELKLNKDFVADSIEYYLTYLIKLALKETSTCPSKKVQAKKRSVKTSQK